MKIRNSMKGHYKNYRDDENLSLGFNPTEYVDTLFGVGSATIAGPTLPAGSIHPSPETLEADCGGYLRNQPIVGLVSSTPPVQAVLSATETFSSAPPHLLN